MNKKTCAQQHFGPWAIDSKWMQNAIASIQSGTWKPKQIESTFDAAAPTRKVTDPLTGMMREIPLYEIAGDVAIISIEDQITKHESSFGGTSTLVTRKAIRAALNDSEIASIMLVVDSPGGTVSGVSDLAYAINKSTKPINAYVEDMCCSAGYWIASQCDSISCNNTAMVGSIGVYTVLYDETGAMEAAGIKARVVSSGGMKGAGADGKVTQELVDDVQREIDSLNELFLAAVAEGRKMDIETVRNWNDGRVHVGQEAVNMKMVDVVESFDEALIRVSKKGKTMNKETFIKYAAENPDADEVKAIRDQGLKAGKTAGREDAVNELKALCEAIPGRSEFVMEQYIKGHDVQSAKAELSDVLSKELEAAKAIKPVTVDATAGTGVVPLAAPADIKTAPESKDPKVIAAHLWASDASVKERFVSESVLAQAIKRGTYQVN